MTDILAGGVVAMAGAILIGIVCLRMAPWALAIATLSFAEALKVACSMLEFTSGQEGVSVLPLFGGGPHEKLFSYYLVLGIALAAVLASFFVMRSRFQFAFQAIHDEEQAASMLGVNPVLFKVLAFALSAFFTGLVGGFYAHYTTFIEPGSVFSIHISVEAQLMPLIGGLYTFVGPILGAFAMTLMTEYLRVSIGQGFMIVYGAVLVATILFLPEGLIGLSRKVRRRFAKAPAIQGA
jgi:branched-chain amino acid transport system permease protein